METFSRECEHCHRPLRGGEMCGCEVRYELSHIADELIEWSGRSGWSTMQILAQLTHYIYNHSDLKG